MTDILQTHPHYLMVYGTLRPGHDNNHVITNHNGKDIGPCRTVGLFVLNNGFPYVWQIRGRRSAGWAEYMGRIVGHLYKVSDAGLEACDRLEGHPRVYKRTNVPIIWGTREKPQYATAGIYLAPGSPEAHQLMIPQNGLLEWGRDEPKKARDFQRRR